MFWECKNSYSGTDDNWFDKVDEGKDFFFGGDGGGVWKPESIQPWQIEVQPWCYP